MNITNSEESEYRTRGKSKIIQIYLVSIRSFITIFYIPISVFIWVCGLGAYDSYFRDILTNIRENSIYSMILEISTYYILYSLIIFWVQFFMIFTLYSSRKIEEFEKLDTYRGKIYLSNYPCTNISIGIYIFNISFLSTGLLLTLKHFFFTDVRVGHDIQYILFITLIIMVVASWLAIRASRYRLPNLKYILLDKQIFTIPFLTSLVISLVFSLYASSKDYEKGYGLSCDTLYSARNYSENGEEYIFSNKQNIGDQDIENITPNMLEHKEPLGNSKWEQEKYNEFRYSRGAVSEKVLSSPVNKEKPIRIKFLKLKDEGDDMRILITDVRKIYESNSHNPKPNDINLLSNPVVITVPKKDLLGRGDGGNGVKKFCVKDSYN